jgi:uncharacterized integral membrane protein
MVRISWTRYPFAGIGGPFAASGIWTVLVVEFLLLLLLDSFTAWDTNLRYAVSSFSLFSSAAKAFVTKSSS